MYCEQFHRGKALSGIPVWGMRTGDQRQVRLGNYQSFSVNVACHRQAVPELKATNKPFMSIIEECFPRVMSSDEDGGKTWVLLCRPIDSYTSPTNRVLVLASSVFGRVFQQNGTVESVYNHGFKELARYNGEGQLSTGLRGDEVLGILYEEGRLRVVPTNPTDADYYELTCRNGTLYVESFDSSDEGEF